MKIFKPTRYHETFRLTFSKKVDRKSEKRAFTVVETTREEIDALIRKVYADNLNRHKENRLDFVKLTVQNIRFETGKPRGKDEWSYRLYRASVDDSDRLMTAVTDSQKEESISEDLLDEIHNRWEDDPHTKWPKCPYKDFKNIACHFADWQKQQLMRNEFEKWAYLEDLLPDTKGGDS